VIDEGAVEMPSNMETPSGAPSEAMPEPATEPTPADDTAQLNVRVPADARIIVNGHLTKSTGSDRRYVSRGLKQGQSYRYEVRAEIERDGQTVHRTAVVLLTGGKRESLAFRFDDEGALALKAAKSPSSL